MEYIEDDDAPAAYLNAMEQREKEELEFYTDLAVQEMQRWVEAVTRKKFKYPEDPKSSLADGVLLCELLNGIKPGTVKRINRLPTPMAGMDNLNVFIDASKRHFGLKEAQLFTPTDLQDFAERARDVELSPSQTKELEDRKIRNVAITVFWLARQVQGIYSVPDIDFTNFTTLVNAKTLNSSLGSSAQFHHRHQYSSSGDWTEPDSLSYKHSRASSRDSADYSIGGMRRGGGGERREGRYSSSDSLDEPDNKYSSKWSSRLDRPGSQNSGSGLRRTSTTQPVLDPLQFIALKPADHLAQKAAKQLELALETKKKRESVDRDEAEWQFMDESWKENLTSWKQRRKSKGSGGNAPEREANEIQTHKYQQFERSHTEGQGHHYSQSQSSQSYDDDEAFDSSTSPLQKTESESSSLRDEHTPGSTSEFKPYIEGNSVEDIIERATIKPVHSQIPDSLSSTGGAAQYSMGKNKMKVRLVTETGSDEGFGFTIKGGKDKCLPITIESVTNDSPADKGELLEGDELLEINEEVVTDRNRGYCMLLINESLQKTGQLDLYLKRDYTKVPTAAKERKQSSNVAPKSILDIYDRLETKDTADNVDGQLSSKKVDVDKIEDEMTRREMEREYRQILDGGYDSAVSTLKSELTVDDRQAYADNQQDKITATAVHASYMSPPTPYNSLPQDYDVRETTSEEVSSKPEAHQSGLADSSGEQNMDGFDQIHDRVSKDFEEVAAPTMSTEDMRLEKRSERMGEENRRRMEEWQKQQEIRQQEEYEREQNEIQRQIEKSRQEAEEFDQNRKTASEPSDVATVDSDGSLSTLTNLRLGMSSAKEKETRDRAVKRLLEIKARYSRDSETNDYHQSDSTNRQGEAANESDDEDDDLAKYRIKTADKAKSSDMKDRYTANYYDFKPAESVAKETPSFSDVYKYYDEDLPTNFGERDPSPPPMSRKDVMNMNKKSTPWRDAKDLPADSDMTWERKEVIASVDDEKVVPPWKRVNANKGLEERRKSAPTRPSWMSEDTTEPTPKAMDKQTDIDPNLPSTLRKEDVLKMTREKARFSAQPRRVSDAPIKSQPINHKSMNAVPIAVRKSAADWVRVQPETGTQHEDEVDRPANKPQRNSMGFFSNRAMFEQQSRDAERYWADQSRENRKQLAKPKTVAMRKAVSTVHPPQLKKENRSKSMDVRPQLNRGDIVRSVDASDAAYERMKELAMMKALREEEAAKAEEDEKERRNRERRIRDERQRELAEIRRMNQQYEAANIQRQQSYSQPDSAESRTDELEKARQRMAREAEELARAHMRHDEEVKTIHGVDMQEERRRRELENSRRSHADDDNRHSRELGDLDPDGRVDAMSRRRHQEMVEQSRRDQQRREEARRIEQQHQRRQEAQRIEQQPQQRSKPPQRHPQQLHHSQQQQQHEWRPGQQDYGSSPFDSKPSTGNADYRQGGALRDPPRNNNHTDSKSRYEPSYSNGYGHKAEQPRADSTNTSKSSLYSAPIPRQNPINPKPLRDEGRDSNYGVPQEGLVKPHAQSTQSSAPPPYQTSSERSLPMSYERQQPLGHNAAHVHQDDYNREMAATSKPFDRLSYDHRRNNSYDRNISNSGYSSSNNDVYSDSMRPYSSEYGSSSNYRAPDPSQLPPRTEDSRYSHMYKNGSTGPVNPHNNNDIYGRDGYMKERSPDPSLAPSKPPRSLPRGEPEEGVATVSAKYSCAYCSKELGKGAAMVIESLGLYYHVECFRCCVCHSLLSNGQMGADVRVRVNRLHCKNCYSNDDAGIKYSAV